MQKSEIKPRTEYALREKRKPGTPFQRVRIIEHIRGNKWKADWIDPNPGLVHYVESRQLIFPWKEQKAFLKEEAAAERLRAHNDDYGYLPAPLTKVVEQVFETAGDDVHFDKGVLSGLANALEPIKVRAGMPGAPNSPVAYTNRQGTIHFPSNSPTSSARRKLQRF